jgi:hypothetical protein
MELLRMTRSWRADGQPYRRSLSQDDHLERNAHQRGHENEGGEDRAGGNEDRRRSGAGRPPQQRKQPVALISKGIGLGLHVSIPLDSELLASREADGE